MIPVSNNLRRQNHYQRLGIGNSRSASASSNRNDGTDVEARSPSVSSVDESKQGGSRWYNTESGRSVYAAGMRVSGAVGAVSFCGGLYSAILFASGEKNALLPLIIFGALLATSCAVSCFPFDTGPDSSL